MQVKHVKQWLAASQKAEKEGETAGGGEAATTMEEEIPETTTEQ